MDERAAAVSARTSRTWRHWTADENAFLIDTHATLTTQQQAERLGRSYCSVSDQRRRLMHVGQLDPSQRKIAPLWSPDEDALLLELLAEGFPARAIARKLDRTYSAVKERCTALGGSAALQRPKDGSQVRTAKEIAQLFNVTEKQVRYWRQWGWLEARRTSRKHRARCLITDNALWVFITNRYTWFGWKPERITDSDWREQALWFRQRACGQWLTTTQVARRIGCAQQSISHEIERGKVSAVRHGRGHYYIWSGDIEKVRQAVRGQL